MKKLLLAFLLIIQFSSASADDQSSALENADRFFSLLEKKQFDQAWFILSGDSREKIISDVVASYKDSNLKAPDKVTLNKNFESCADICTAYWNGFLVNFRPEEVLLNSEWSISVVKKNYIEIQLINKKAAKPAILKMFKENNDWKLGLTESFWLRRYFQN